MPLTAKGETILSNMIKEFGSREKGERVFYASRNAGTITGVDSADDRNDAGMDLDHVIDGIAAEARRLDARIDSMVGGTT